MEANELRIDVKELRVGNLVLGYYTYDDENDQEQEITSVCRVLSIDSVGAHEYPLWVEAIGKTNDVEEYDGFVAIPLTEEWLLKFGFEKCETCEEQGYQKGVYKIFINSLGEVNFCFFDFNDWYKHIEYAHQLQNLYFALTGEELTLTK